MSLLGLQSVIEEAGVAVWPSSHSTGLDSGELGFSPCFAMDCQASHFPAQCLSFPICGMGIMVPPSSVECLEICGWNVLCPSGGYYY